MGTRTRNPQAAVCPSYYFFQGLQRILALPKNPSPSLSPGSPIVSGETNFCAGESGVLGSIATRRFTTRPSLFTGGAKRGLEKSASVLRICVEVAFCANRSVVHGPGRSPRPSARPPGSLSKIKRRPAASVHAALHFPAFEICRYRFVKALRLHRY
ncbi:hypothetical protein EVAR_28128_1 [Eumeta japonica]|uniref:Uncharacterized protein n=1 Tax=Eumeta variegata TaxID=151549 RepID=A0A4C1VEW7_EUMVA|nr:hypothetical protein EVAR_28128_1 [Eumeta japonica]